jgi:hypothetical protein
MMSSTEVGRFFYRDFIAVGKEVFIWHLVAAGERARKLLE